MTVVSICEIGEKQLMVDHYCSFIYLSCSLWINKWAQHISLEISCLHCAADKMALLSWWGCRNFSSSAGLLLAVVSPHNTNNNTTHITVPFLLLLMREVTWVWLLFIPSCIRRLWAAVIVADCVTCGLCLVVIFCLAHTHTDTHVHMPSFNTTSKI